MERTFSRRDFISMSMAATATVGVIPGAVNASPHPVNLSITIQGLIDEIIKGIPNAPFSQTVDTIKTGSPDSVVTGVVTTTFATINVIRKAIELKANFIIAHEPTFYNHADDVSWLQDHEVYQSKR